MLFIGWSRVSSPGCRWLSPDRMAVFSSRIRVWFIAKLFVWDAMSKNDDFPVPFLMKMFPGGLAVVIKYPPCMDKPIKHQCNGEPVYRLNEVCPL